MFIITKTRNPLNKPDLAYTALKAAVAGIVQAAPGELTSDALLAQLRAALPSGWSGAEITEGTLRQAVQDLGLNHYTTNL